MQGKHSFPALTLLEADWLRTGLTDDVITQFSQNNKLIVFVSSCETAEFLYVLFTAVLRGPRTNQEPGVSFLRLHGNMKQEARADV